MGSRSTTEEQDMKSELKIPLTDIAAWWADTKKEEFSVDFNILKYFCHSKYCTSSRFHGSLRVYWTLEKKFQVSWSILWGNVCGLRYGIFCDGNWGATS